MTNEKAISMIGAKLECLNRRITVSDIMCNVIDCDNCELNYAQGNMGEQREWLKMSIDALQQKSRKGQWLRMSDLSEQEDDRYKCSYCGNVIHYKNKMNLYTFNSWCGRCGSDNERKIEVEL